MPYSVVFGMRNKPELSAAEAATASETLAFIDELQRSDQEIKYIRSPHEGEIGIEMLRVLAKEEDEEMPISPDRGRRSRALIKIWSRATHSFS
jgi:hypothetical protein